MKIFKRRERGIKEINFKRMKRSCLQFNVFKKEREEEGPAPSYDQQNS